MKKNRLDDLLLQKGLIKDKKDAFVKVTEGAVFVDGQKAISPAQLFLDTANIVMKGGRRFVGRGAYKVEAALKQFNILVKDKVCADLGAATGGFTQVLLEQGAKKVYAIDTAKGKMDLKIREDVRVVVMEETDVRNISKLPELIEIVTIDISLISLRNILPSIVHLLASDAVVVVLFKPQYETRNQSILKHGVIKDDIERENLLKDFMNWCKENGWKTENWTISPIRGDKGNAEYLLELRR